MSGHAGLARRRARRQARSLAVRLRARIRDAAPGHSPAGAYLAGELRATLNAIDEALLVGLDFGSPGDAELGFRRGHAVNAALVIRRNVEGASSPGAGPESRTGDLARAVRFADELIAAVEWVDRCLLELESEGRPDAWTRTWSARFLAAASKVLPARQRAAFIEDQCGNLSFAASRRERAGYLLSLVIQLPDIAAAARAADRRRPAPRP